MSTIELLRETILAYHTVPVTVISSTAAWATMYILLKVISKQEPEWTIRVITTFHATIITTLAAKDWSHIKQWSFEKLGEPNSKYEEVILCLTLGYFFFDLVWIIKYKTEGIAMYCHHVLSIWCLVFILWKGSSAPEVLMGITGLELTNPCLQIRWFLRNYGYNKSWLYEITEYLFMATFIIFRIFYGTYLTFCIIMHPKCHFALKMGTFGLYTVSWAFACQMISYVNKRKRKPYKVKK